MRICCGGPYALAVLLSMRAVHPVNGQHISPHLTIWAMLLY